MKNKITKLIVALLFLFGAFLNTEQTDALSIDKEDETIEEYQEHWENYFPEIDDMSWIVSVDELNEFDLEFTYVNERGERITTRFINDEARKAKVLSDFEEKNHGLITFAKVSFIGMGILVAFGILRIRQINKKYDNKEKEEP